MSRPYDAPLPLIRAAIDQARELSGLGAAVSQTDPVGEVADAVLEGAARLARKVLSPLNRPGDAAGCRLTGEGVATPDGFPWAYAQFRAGGWPAICAPEMFGGQALPWLIGAAATEMWGAANLAFAMCPEAAAGAVEALRLHAAPALRECYLPPLVSGEWTAAMALTESQAGSDLSTLRTLAEPDGDDWRIRGRKIFISWGDHDLAENIVHLVLARTPGAPPGLKGISLFLVPKRLPCPDGALAPNDLHAVSIEHKMGIRASPTCVMAYGERGGARGWLIGPLHAGLACLFSMMNTMRVGVGLHSVGLAERAWQLAQSYAHERLQGRNAAGAQRPIVEHGDVRRMLLTMRSLTRAARSLAYLSAATIDLSRAATEETVRAQADRRLALLTPLVKAWCSDTAVEVASLGVQVHGGTGYVDDSEISQVYRDARIGPIFEGTNYIQAQDLLARKVIRDGGAALEELLREMEGDARALRAEDTPATRERESLRPLAAGLLSECARLRAAAAQLAQASATQPELAGCVAYPFLQWLAVVAGGWQHCAGAARALVRPASDPIRRTQLDDARFYAAHIFPRAHAHAAAVASGADLLLPPDAAEL